MAIRKTPQGTYEIRWRDQAGNQHKKRFKRYDPAVRHEREVLGKVQDGTWVDPGKGKMPLRDWAKTWLAGAHNLRPRTVAIYDAALVHVNAALGDTPLNRVTADDIDDYLAARLKAGAAPSSVHREYRTLRRMFRLAVDRGKLARSPISDVTEPRIPDHEMRFLTAAELMTLAASVDWLRPGRGKPAVPVPERYRTFILVAGWGGLRWGELAGLDVAHVDTTGSRVHIVRQLDPAGDGFTAPKSRASRRWVTLPPDVTTELAAHCKGRDGLVWTMPKGGPLSQTAFRSRIWLPAIERAGINGMRVHDLRHTAVALAISTGAHPKAIQMRMGHASIRVTLDLYGHLFEGIDGAVAGKLNELLVDARPKLRVV